MNNDKTALEGIPHICRKVCLIWGTSELDTFINSVVMDSRDGERRGLPIEVAADLLWLAKFNKFRRAHEFQLRLKISLEEAYAKVQAEDLANTGVDQWADPTAGGVKTGRQRQGGAAADRLSKRNPPRSSGSGNSLFGTIFGLATSRFTLYLIGGVLSFKLLWPLLKVYFK